jgi:hypothetical protein
MYAEKSTKSTKNAPKSFENKISLVLTATSLIQHMHILYISEGFALNLYGLYTNLEKKVSNSSNLCLRILYVRFLK